MKRVLRSFSVIIHMHTAHCKLNSITQTKKKLSIVFRNVYIRLSVCYLIFIASIIYCLTNLTYFNCLSILFFRSAYMILFYLYIMNFFVMFLAAAHSYLFLCLRLSNECLVSASEQVFNPDEWRGINAL